MTRVVVINKYRDRSFTVRVRVHGSSGTLERLTAPSAYSRTGVRLAGQSIGSHTGLLSGHRETPQVRARHGVFSLAVPAASALLLTVN